MRLFLLFLLPALLLTQPLRADLPAQPSITLTIDSTEAPDLQPWGEKAKTICEEWYPRICAELASEGFTPPSTGKIVFRKELSAPAATSSGAINVNADYIRHHEGDLGMMVHELTHIVQSYQRTPRGMGWMTEGIADYIRWHIYEPGKDHSRIDPKTATYHDSYRTTARFLAFVANAYDKSLVTKLNARMRAGKCSPTDFKDITGKDVDDLWSEFIATLDPKAAPATKPTGDPSLAFAISYNSFGKRPSGLIQACWDDGLVIFALNPELPGTQLQCGRITAAQAATALTEMWAAGLFDTNYTRGVTPDHSTYRFRAARNGKSADLEWDELLTRPWGAHTGADPAYQRFAKIWMNARTIATFALPTDYTPLDKNPDAEKRFKALP